MDTQIQDMMGCIEDHLHHGTKVDQCIMAHLAHQPTITIKGTPGYIIEKLDMAPLGHSGCIRRVQDQLVHVLQVLWSCCIFSKEYSGRAESHRFINAHLTHLKVLNFHILAVTEDRKVHKILLYLIEVKDFFTVGWAPVLHVHVSLNKFISLLIVINHLW